MDTSRHDRDFKGVWIPKEIWLSTQLSLMEKVLFVEIHSLDNELGCYASNRYFADFFGISERQIRTYVGSLKEKGFITVSVVNQNERTIHTAGRYARVPEEVRRMIDSGARQLVDKFSLNRRGGRKKSS